MIPTENRLLEILATLNGKDLQSRIKTCLTLRGITQRTISKKKNIPYSNLSMVVSGKRKTPWIRKALAEALGISVEILFQSAHDNVESAKAQSTLSSPSAKLQELNHNHVFENIFSHDPI